MLVWFCKVPYWCRMVSTRKKSTDTKLLNFCRSRGKWTSEVGFQCLCFALFKVLRCSSCSLEKVSLVIVFTNEFYSSSTSFYNLLSNQCFAKGFSPSTDQDLVPSSSIISLTLISSSLNLWLLQINLTGIKPKPLSYNRFLGFQRLLWIAKQTLTAKLIC